MKFSYAALFVFVPSIFAASVPNTLEKREGGAFKTCSGATVFKSGKSVSIRMKCGDGRGGHKTTSLDLGQCLSNKNGELVWRKNGRFADTCQLDDGKNTGLRYNTDLYIWCNKGGQSVVAAINLNDRLVNRGGRLICDV
ncbi:hypothetical protein Dda_7211 [Drechslerella dactyloides]|uniref:Cyanovirin-N domain-containing protein n=1 Tax=Drechslerella dactyloides TaxID=74499 RepID=A0AAD6ITD4_DREDA|nr:hypothetical protein Dda_7211 [Drechslerella dactyloides]